MNELKLKKLVKGLIAVEHSLRLAENAVRWFDCLDEIDPVDAEMVRKFIGDMMLEGVFSDEAEDRLAELRDDLRWIIDKEFDSIDREF